MSASVGPAAAPLVVVERVVKTFGGKQALRGVTFAVPAGQVCGLLGAHSAGKTTLLRLLMGLQKATSGRIEIDGLDAYGDRVELKRRIGFLPDAPVFYADLTSRELLQLSAGLHGLDVETTMAGLQPLVERLRLVDEMEAVAAVASPGAKKKLGLLLALLHQPKLLILDEPTDGLDAESTHLLDDLILELAAKGTTVLFSTHLVDDVARLCSQVVVIDRGTVVAEGARDELCAAHGEKSFGDVLLELTQAPVE